MIERLPKIAICGNYPSFYDTDAKTSLELNAITYGKVNELIAAYNTWTENSNKIIQDFIDGQIADREIFETALRQEFQDFIDIVDLKVRNQDKKIDDAVEYMQTNLSKNVQTYVNTTLADLGVALTTAYDDSTKSLNFVFVKE